LHPTGQFLFRPTDVGEMKSTAAAKAVLKMNPSVNAQSAANRVCPESENVYNDAFWQKLDGCITALDNVYVVQLFFCFFFRFVFFVCVSGE
jgi:ubiquitin-activating enzyme E1